MYFFLHSALIRCKVTMCIDIHLKYMRVCFY